MAFPKTFFGLLGVGAAGLVFYACSTNSGEPDSGNGLFSQNGGGFANGTGRDASLGNGLSNSSAGGGGSVIFGASGGSTGDPHTAGDACPAIHQKPETITVYKDATVTDTIYTSKPVALFVMMDRSGSMVTGFPPPASADSWNNATAAITSFVTDSRTVGIDIGLGTFPAGANNTADCSGGTDCGTPVVPIAPLPGNGQAMIQAMQQQSPNSPITLTPTECGLRGMINQCLQFQANSPSGEQCVAILVTDGTPTQCSTDATVLQGIVKDGHDKGVTTYVLGLPGSDLNALNALANLGGTTGAIDVSGGSSAFIDALNNIRQTVAVTTTQHISTPTVISTPLPCQWKIPVPQGNTTFDKTKVNVQFIPPGGAAPIDFGNVPSLADCARTTADAWYYDNNDNPTEILACPNTCGGTLHNSAGAEVDVVFGCATHFIFH